jgi:hypothetical protein
MLIGIPMTLKDVKKDQEVEIDINARGRGAGVEVRREIKSIRKGIIIGVVQVAVGVGQEIGEGINQREKVNGI